MWKLARVVRGRRAKAARRDGVNCMFARREVLVFSVYVYGNVLSLRVVLTFVAGSPAGSLYLEVSQHSDDLRDHEPPFNSRQQRKMLGKLDECQPLAQESR